MGSGIRVKDTPAQTRRQKGFFFLNERAAAR